MARITITRHVDAPPEAVFDRMTDLEHAAEHIPDIVQLDVLTDGPVGVGTRFRETRTVFGKQATEEMEITEFEPGRGYTLECESCGALFRTRFDLEPDGGGTLVRSEMQTTPVSLGAKLMSPFGFLFRGMYRKCMEKDLDAVAQSLDGAPPTGSSPPGAPRGDSPPADSRPGGAMPEPAE